MYLNILPINSLKINQSKPCLGVTYSEMVLSASLFNTCKHILTLLLSPLTEHFLGGHFVEINRKCAVLNGETAWKAFYVVFVYTNIKKVLLTESCLSQSIDPTSTMILLSNMISYSHKKEIRTSQDKSQTGTNLSVMIPSPTDL